MFPGSSQIKNSLIVKAKNIRLYKDFLLDNNNNNKYAWALKILYSLSEQIKYLIQKESKCFYRLDIENVLMIDDFFLYISTDVLCSIEEDGSIHVFKKEEEKKKEKEENIFYSPEWFHCHSNNRIHYKTIYYSLGLLLISFLFEEDREKKKEEKEEKKEEKLPIICESIYGTKLYSFLSRCLKEEASQRYLIFL
jgi:hypothetical protein